MQMQIDKHKVIDHVEDNVDALLSRLEGQVGTGVKIMTEEEEEEERIKKQEREQQLAEEMENIAKEKEKVLEDKEKIENELYEYD